jgi:hypothetical protein
MIKSEVADVATGYVQRFAGVIDSRREKAGAICCLLLLPRRLTHIPDIAAHILLAAGRGTRTSAD